MPWSDAFPRSITIPAGAGPGEPRIVLDGDTGKITIYGADPDAKIVLDPDGPSGVYPNINLQNTDTVGDVLVGLADGGLGPELIGGEYVNSVTGNLVRQVVRLSHFLMQLGARTSAASLAEGGGLVLADDVARLAYYAAGAATRSLVVDDTGWTVDGGAYMGRGLVNSVIANTNAAGVAAGTEAIVMTLPNFTYKAGRAYEVRHNGGVNPTTVANSRVWWRVKKTNLAGQVVALYIRETLPVVGQVYDISHSGRKFTVGAADVAAVLVLCLNAEVGTVVHTGTILDCPRSVEIWDVGVASDYPTWPVLV